MSLVALYDALKAADVPDDKAAAAVEAVQDSRDEAWKRRIEREIAALRQELAEFKGEIRSEMAEMKGDIRRLDAQLKLMFGIVVPLLVAILVRSFWV